MANVIFRFGTRAQYEAIAAHDVNTLYWLSDTQELYKGDILFGCGLEATTAAAGLLSAEDKAKLDSLTQSGLLNLRAVDASVILGNDAGDKTIGVNISKVEGNALSLKDDGLFVSLDAAGGNATYAIEKQSEATDGYSATYKLKKTVGENSEYVGDEINIPKDLVVKSGSVGTVAEAGVPYAGAVVGDTYIELVLSDAAASHIYIPAKGLVDISNKVDQDITNADGSVAKIFNEYDGGGAMFTHQDGTKSFVGVNNGGAEGLAAQIYAVDTTNNNTGSRIFVGVDGIYYTSDQAAGVGYNSQDELVTKKDLKGVAGTIEWQDM